jgi:hypothetical protein
MSIFGLMEMARSIFGLFENLMTSWSICPFPIYQFLCSKSMRRYPSIFTRSPLCLSFLSFYLWFLSLSLTHIHCFSLFLRFPSPSHSLSTFCQKIVTSQLFVWKDVPSLFKKSVQGIVCSRRLIMKINLVPHCTSGS